MTYINAFMMYISCMHTHTGDIDYYLGPYHVTFIAGNTTAHMGAPVRDDRLVERTEYFNLTIDSSSLPSSVSLGDPCETMIIIMDDDSK